MEDHGPLFSCQPLYLNVVNTFWILMAINQCLVIMHLILVSEHKEKISRRKNIHSLAKHLVAFEELTY
jgi:hypothetical protein